MENNGRGIFYGVIGVATLVVAIIGATFAYFSAQAGSQEEITATGAKISLEWAENKYFKTNLIPVETGFADTAQAADENYNATTAATTFASSTYVGPTECEDKNGNAICSMYDFTITNPSTSTAAQQVYASFTPTTNTFTNLKFAIFKGSASSITSWNVNDTVDGTGTSVGAGKVAFSAYALTKNDDTAIRLTTLDQVIPVGESVTYTIIVWLEETGADQQVDQGQSFAGRIDFTTANGGQGVTGVLTA